jgi:hypothetical protein
MSVEKWDVSLFLFFLIGLAPNFFDEQDIRPPCQTPFDIYVFFAAL